MFFQTEKFFNCNLVLDVDLIPLGSYSLDDFNLIFCNCINRVRFDWLIGWLIDFFQKNKNKFTSQTIYCICLNVLIFIWYTISFFCLKITHPGIGIVIKHLGVLFDITIEDTILFTWFKNSIQPIICKKLNINL